MKKAVTTLSMIFLLTLTSFSQNLKFLDGYKYVYINQLTYKDGSVDKFGIVEFIKTQFSEKGYLILRSDSKQWPDEAIANPCLILHCTLSHTYDNFAGITVTIKLSNCKASSLYKHTASQIIGSPTSYYFQRAASKAFKYIEKYSYTFKSSFTPVFDYPKVEQTDETEETISAYLSSKVIDPIEGIYKSIQNDGLSFYKFGIIKKGNKYKAIIIESNIDHWKVGEVKAYFEPSSIKDIFSTKWYLVNKLSIETFASIDKDVLLSIDFNNLVNGEKTQSKFIKMFPSTSVSQIPKKIDVKASGSGFFLTTDGVIATNAHVIEGASNIEITFTNEVGSFTHKAKVLLSDANNDVALLKVIDDTFKGFNSIPYGIIEKVETGEKVFTIGYPLNDVMGTNYKVNDGIISSQSGIEDDIRYFQISVPLQPGNSGGPLFNKDGNIIGITSARLNGEVIGARVENVNYAIKASYLLNLYNMLPDSAKLNSTSQVANKELQDQIKLLKNYVCLIKIF